MDFTSHQAYASPVKRKVLGDLKNTGDSPISPTANLKLLTKVASQFRILENTDTNTDIPNNFYSIEIETKTPPKTVVKEESFEAFDELNILCNTHQQGKGVRKFKSLGFLCDKGRDNYRTGQPRTVVLEHMPSQAGVSIINKLPDTIKHATIQQIFKAKLKRLLVDLFCLYRFLTLYPLNVGGKSFRRITLTDLASNLAVEKRRVYDIINVVESLQMATRIGKNSYVWTGHKKLVDMLSQLKAYAEQIGLTHYVRMQQINRGLYSKLNVDEIEHTECSAFEQNSNIASFFKNERRIGILCQKFVMLFLVSLKDGLVNLELAANVLMSENCQQNKTRLRRLYDIANILVSLGIISKLDIAGDWKKPVFRYVGPSLHSLTSLNIDGSFINKFVKTEYSDENSSDLSLSDGSQFKEDSGGSMSYLKESILPSYFYEDSHEPWRSEQLAPQPLLATHCDHSYSMVFEKMAEKKDQSGEPAAKKRLFLNDQPAERSVVSAWSVEERAATSEPVESPRVKPTPTILRVTDQGSLPQPITDGGVYKALRVGNNIQLIRMDSA